MSTRYVALVVAFVALVAGLLVFRTPPTVDSRPTRLNTDIPGLANYRESLVHYATITRPDNRSRDLYITPDVAQQVADNSTARLPDGTVIVIEAYHTRAGPDTPLARTELVDNIHVAVKSDSWQPADYQTAERAGDWNYFSFDPGTGAMTDEPVFECFDCHANNSQIDFMFSRDELAAFGEANTRQDAFCNRPGRLPCR